MLNFKELFRQKLLNKNLVSYSTFLLIFFTAFPFLLFNLYSWGKIFPGIKITEVDVGGLNTKDAEELLRKEINIPEVLTLTSDNQVFEINLQEIDYSINYSASVFSAHNRYRTGNVLYDTLNRIRIIRNPNYVGVKDNFDYNKLSEYLSVILGQIETEPVEPSLKFKENNISVEKGVKGKKTEMKKLIAEIEKSLSLLSHTSLTIPTYSVGKTLTDTQSSAYKRTGEEVIGKSISFKFDIYEKNLNDEEIINLLDLNTTLKDKGVDEIIIEIQSEIEREPQNSVLTFEGGKVQEFLPSKEGIKVSRDALTEKFLEVVKELINTETKYLSIDIPVTKTQPAVKTEDVNNLGIEELIGRGISNFSGSISSRKHNISVASSKFNGVLVKPGNISSFNNILGDVSAYTGYKQAYIIKDGKTMLGDGGGVCQVSTTLFRAILDTGLPVIERRFHSYRVGYYEQDSPPGFDATVYAPTTDLKFKNDTPGHLLIQTQYISNKSILIFEIYGTSDGRISSTTKPVVTSVIPPPEDLYIDDPTLPAGTIKQIDYKAWGAKVNFKYTVEKKGEVTYEKTFYSNYQPWQAKFLRGTAPVN